MKLYPSKILPESFGALIVMLITLSTTACSNTMSWNEEVKLADGRVIRVTQKHRYDRVYDGQSVGNMMRESWLSFDLPEFSSQHITWHENLRPMILNIEQGRLYIVGIPLTRIEFLQYGKPRPSYVAYIFDRGDWKRIAFSEIPKSLYDANLWLDNQTDNNASYISLAEKQSQMKELGVPGFSKRLDLSFFDND